MPEKILVFKRKIKYPRIEISSETLKVILPEKELMNPKEVLRKYQNWIKKKKKFFDEIKKLEKEVKIFNQENLSEKISALIEEKSKILKIKPKAISFRKMKKRWASCTRDNRLIFNKNLKFLPDNLIDYIVTHEMCHLWVKNHKKEFWYLMQKFYDKETVKHLEKLLLTYLKVFLKNLIKEE